MSQKAVQPPSDRQRRSYSVRELVATKRLGGSRNAIYNLIASGKLRSYWAAGRRIDEQAVDDCVAVLEREARVQPIDPEVSKRKAAAGRKGREKQLAAA